jgi:hypothetical protein
MFFKERLSFAGTGNDDRRATEQICSRIRDFIYRFSGHFVNIGQKIAVPTILQLSPRAPKATD